METKDKTPKAIKEVHKKLSETNIKDFPIVAIGASAGGLEALEEFFENIPKDNGMAFVVIQHLDPNHADILPELLQKKTSMKVLQVTDGLLAMPNHVYVIPPNKSMSVLNGVLLLFAPIEIKGLRLPIDFFFRSLAIDRNDKSIGIILSGMGSDGSLGIKDIKEKNGLVLVQAPTDAKFNGMPSSAINSVVADIIAPAAELPAKLMLLLQHIPHVAVETENEFKNKNNLDKIIVLLRTQTGHDFSMYKKSTLFRRIERRMAVHQIIKIANYVLFLQENPTEIDILFKELLIGVTNFFRDAEVWQKLKDIIFPELFKHLPNGYKLRAWVTACSTGEEAYSLAIAFQEAMENDKSNNNFTLQIFATDIDKDAIEIARKANFAANIVADVSPERIKKFFAKTNGGFRVNTNIREMIVFAPHNVIKDPPFTKLDFLSCRNLLIYMEPELQKKLTALFHYSLNINGIILLGNSENENSQNGLFTPIDTKLKFYKRSAANITNELLDFPSSYYHKTTETTKTTKTINKTTNLQALVDELILQKFAPASVLINGNGDILYITGHTGKYLEPSAGKANMNVFAMAREGLSIPLLSAIRKARQNYEPHILSNLKVGNKSAAQYVDITVQHIEKPEAISGTILLVFNDIATIIKQEKTDKAGNEIVDVYKQEFQLDLQRAFEDLQSTKEEMQTSQEELKSTNEELQSSNEELQSTNEELTTSKEEMQSLNEELKTVNTELQSKVSDFEQASNVIKNWLNCSDIATLFLDKELNIRRYTQQVAKIIKLRPSDIGRPFTDIISQLQYSEIEADAKKVLRTMSSIETNIEARDARWFTVKIMPYQTYEDRIDGLVITFIDISDTKKSELAFAAANKELAFQNKEKQKRANELVIANKELAFQNKEKQKRADELVIANKKLALDNKEKKRLEEELDKANELLRKHKLV